MGACFNSITFPTMPFAELKKKFEAKALQMLDDYGSHSYAGHLGLKRGVEDSGKVFKTANEAKDYISNNTDKFDDLALAVKFGDFQALEATSTKEIKLIQKLHKDNELLKLLNEKISLRIKLFKKAGATANFITCRDCKSKIASRFINNCECPICGSMAFVYNAAEQKAYLKLNASVKDIQKQLDEFKKKKIEKDPSLKNVGWVVGGWCSE